MKRYMIHFIEVWSEVNKEKLENYSFVKLVATYSGYPEEYEMEIIDFFMSKNDKEARKLVEKNYDCEVFTLSRISEKIIATEETER